MALESQTMLTIGATGDAVIGAITLDRLRRKGIDPNSLDIGGFRNEAYATFDARECLYTSAMTGLLLLHTYPGMFQKMFLIQSTISQKLLAGEGGANFDTYLILQDNDGVYYAVSPGLQKLPDDPKLVTVHQAESLAHIIQKIEYE